MNKIINLFFLFIIVTFFFNIYKYYSSNNNVKNINLNRLNINKIIVNKVSNLPILQNDTNNIIEFNSSYSKEIKNNDPRSFWNLLKSK
jgi:hypothetical protein